TNGGGAAGAAISLISDGAINPSGSLSQQLSLNAGSGAITLTSGVVEGDIFSHPIRMNTLMGGAITATAPGSIQTNAITAAGPIRLTSTGNSLSISDNIVSGN